MKLTIMIEYPNGTLTKAGVAHTIKGAMKIAYGGGNTPWGRDDKGELWHAEIIGEMSDLRELGASLRNGGWMFTSPKGHEIPCIDASAPIGRRAPVVTAESITDEQIMALLADAQSVEGLCNRALYDGDPSAKDERRKARATLATILNERWPT